MRRHLFAGLVFVSACGTLEGVTGTSGDVGPTEDAAADAGPDAPPLGDDSSAGFDGADALADAADATIATTCDGSCDCPINADCDFLCTSPMCTLSCESKSTCTIAGPGANCEIVCSGAKS
ncbi:MAG TPA: hypothetical protein VIF62_00875, partial [Labilithrix sp.]